MLSHTDLNKPIHKLLKTQTYKVGSFHGFNTPAVIKCLMPNAAALFPVLASKILPR
jgi:hypothetical protein